MKKCPYCAEEIQNEAIKCRHCGEMVGGSEVTQSPRRAGSSVLRVLGFLVFLGGFGALVFYWQFYDTSVDVPSQTIFGQTIGGGRVHNIGLMQDRQNGMIIGGVFGALGFVCATLGQRGSKN